MYMYIQLYTTHNTIGSTCQTVDSACTYTNCDTCTCTYPNSDTIRPLIVILIHVHIP